MKVDPTVGWEPVVNELRAGFGPAYEIDRPDSRGASVETMVRSFQLGLNLGSAVALLVGVFLVYNTVSISVLQRRREIGTLRALGTTKRDIRALFAIEAMVLGLIGSALGIPFGLVVGRGAISWVSDTVSQLYVQVNAQDVQLGTSEMALGAALGILGSVFAALRPAVIASGVQPVEALRRDVAVGAGAVNVRSWPTYLGVALFVLAGPATLIPPPVENLPVGGYISIFFILMGATLLSPLLLRRLNTPLAAPGLHGAEIVNLHAGAMTAGKLGTLGTALFLPIRSLCERISLRDDAVLAAFDEALQTKHPFTPIGGNDAHANIQVFGPLGGTIADYREVFLTLSTHVLAERLDERSIVEAFAAGRTYVSFDVFGEGTGFDFRAVDALGVHCPGSSVPLGPELSMQATVPDEAHIRLLRDGRVVGEVHGRSARWAATEAGVHRVEVWRDGDVPWLFSSSIAVVPPGDATSTPAGQDRAAESANAATQRD